MAPLLPRSAQLPGVVGHPGGGPSTRRHREVLPDQATSEVAKDASGITKDRFNVNVTIENNDMLFHFRSDSMVNLAAASPRAARHHRAFPLVELASADGARRATRGPGAQVGIPPGAVVPATGRCLLGENRSSADSCPSGDPTWPSSSEPSIRGRPVPAS